MRKIGAYALVGALAVGVFPSSSFAFGLRLGPFELPLPLFGHPVARARPHRVAAETPANSGAGVYDKVTSAGPGSVPDLNGANPALLSPNLALPNLYDHVFWPRQSSAWPYGYDAIFRTAFDRSADQRGAQACPQMDRATAVVGRIRAEVRPDSKQMPLLQKLGEALGMASGYLTKSCPPQLPAQPIARLQLMQGQIQALTMALDIVRPPLQQFEQSLTDSQRSRFADMRSARSAGADSCGAAAVPTNWSIDQISQAVQTTDDQRDALDGLRQAFTGAASDLYAHCPQSLPGTPLARLEAIESRLDASWRAVLAMQVALGKFEAQLSAAQRNRFETFDVAAAH